MRGVLSFRIANPRSFLRLTINLTLLPGNSTFGKLVLSVCNYYKRSKIPTRSFTPCLDTLEWLTCNRKREARAESNGHVIIFSSLFSYFCRVVTKKLKQKLPENCQTYVQRIRSTIIPTFACIWVAWPNVRTSMCFLRQLRKPAVLSAWYWSEKKDKTKNIEIFQGLNSVLIIPNHKNSQCMHKIKIVANKSKQQGDIYVTGNNFNYCVRDLIW